MRSVLIAALDPGIEVGLEFGDRSIDLLAEDDAVELIAHRLVEALDDAIRLRALGLGARMAPELGAGDAVLRLSRGRLNRTPDLGPLAKV